MVGRGRGFAMCARIMVILSDVAGNDVKRCVILTLFLHSAGEVENTWDEWSVCVCDHGLNMSKDSGVMYRVPKCRRICPNVTFCADSVEFQPCKCQSAGKCFM